MNRLLRERMTGYLDESTSEELNQRDAGKEGEKVLPPLRDEVLYRLFRTARTHNAWLDRPVSDELLRQPYDLMKWEPTSANLCPALILFLHTREARERLRPALMSGNVEKTMAAPVTAIVAYDERFYEQKPRLFPHSPGMRDLFLNSPDLAEATAFRNGTLQGA